MSRCFWCLNEARGNHIEHIVPEAIGCPPGFTISSEWICVRCNNGLGHLDQAVGDDFDFLALMNGIPRKGNKPPKISSRGNVLGTVETDGPAISFNMGNAPVTAHDQSELAPYRGRDRDIRATFDSEGLTGTVSFDVKFGASRKFVRGIYKIAFSALGYLVSFEELYREKYNFVRKYVRKGVGDRHILLYPEPDGAYSHHFGSPIISDPHNYLMSFRLGHIRFFVDLSETEFAYERLKAESEKQLGKKGWTYLPIDS